MAVMIILAALIAIGREMLATRALEVDTKTVITDGKLNPKRVPVLSVLEATTMPESIVTMKGVWSISEEVGGAFQLFDDTGAVEVACESGAGICTALRHEQSVVLQGEMTVEAGHFLFRAKSIIKVNRV